MWIPLLLPLNMALAEPLPQESATLFAKTQEEKDEEIAAAEAEFAAKTAKKARVIVLKWPKTTTNRTDANLKLNVQSAINRTDVEFLPAVDLYQQGRVIRDTTSSKQVGRVPSSAISTALLVAQENASVSYDDLTSDEWKLKARDLRKALDSIWFVDRKEL